MKRLVWLASYPKSGNTWMRMLFAAYHQHGDKSLQLRDAFNATMSESRRTEFEKLAGKSELTVDEIDRLREAVQLSIVNRIKPPILLKTHNARVQHNGYPVIRKELTLGAVYIVRNPLDVVDSFADHQGESIDVTIGRMNDGRHSIGGPNSEFVTQYLDTWSNHVRSWVYQRIFPVHVVRYEDLLAATEFTFRNVLTFLGWDLNPDRIDFAIAETKFTRLREREAKAGFEERSKKSRSGTFFRRGQAGTWPQILTRDQAFRVIQNHGEMMVKLGYEIPDLSKIY